MPGKPPTVTEILAKASTPTFNVYQSKRGDIVVKVSGVPKPFEFQVSRQTLKDDAVFGVVTTESAMRTAHTLARLECSRRGFI